MILGFKKQFVPKILDGSKIHTIREDKHDRWKAGRTAHMATGVRTKDYHQFDQQECTGTQKIEIIHYKPHEIRPFGGCPKVFVDGRELPLNEVDTIAKNDGFDGLSDFCDWFNKDFSGKIIHWTELRY